jgi:hypothetical protein
MANISIGRVGVFDGEKQLIGDAQYPLFSSLQGFL